MKQEEKRYNVVVWPNRNKARRVTMNQFPMTHSEACNMLSRITKYPWRTEIIEQVR